MPDRRRLALQRWFIGRPDLAVENMVVNLVFNVYPMMHHRRTRARIVRLLSSARERGLLDRLDQRTAWQFVAILYVGRWIALAPVLIVSHFVLTQEQNAASAMPDEWREGSPLGLFVGLVLIPAILETLLECSLP